MKKTPTNVTALTPFMLPEAPPRDDLLAGLSVGRVGDEGLEPPTSRM